MDTEKQLKELKAEQSRLMRWFMVPGIILFAFVISSSSTTIMKLIAPLSVGTVMIILCFIDIAIAIPIAIKLDKIKKQILKINEKNSP